jgi:Ca-activated chloride channel family protein
MRFPWLGWACLAAVAIVAAAGWMALREAGRRSGARGWVANSGYVRELPKYRTLMRRTRWAVAATAACLVVLTAAVSVSAGAPVDRRVEDRRLSSRDIVLCLDSSGSMIPYDAEIAGAFRQMVDHFSGERIALHLWSARTMVMFPLTDDYDMAGDTLDEVGRLMGEGYQGQDDSGVYVTNELYEFLEATDDPNMEVSSLAGDGLAGCVLGFDHTDQQRSRMVILATDNEVLGAQIYTLSQAVDLARDHDVLVTALYPGDTAHLSAEGEELRDQVRLTGGDFYDAHDPSSVDGIIADIEAQQVAEVQGSATTVETDRPERALAWVALSLLVLLGLAAWARL